MPKEVVLKGRVIPMMYGLYVKWGEGDKKVTKIPEYVLREAHPQIGDKVQLKFKFTKPRKNNRRSRRNYP